MSGQARMKAGQVVELEEAETQVADWQKDKMAGLRIATIEGDGSAMRFLRDLAYNHEDLSVRQLAVWSIYHAAMNTRCAERQGNLVGIIRTAASLPGLNESIGSHVLDLATRNIRYMQGHQQTEPTRSANDTARAQHLALVANQRRATAG